ncbi:acetate--CoA ligase family protein [Burkholderia cenocepacia]|uniref:acetate--CoA ligase family protein n=1 Tax=Burkholderia cenocepacia TaxID=95486 RepID=UPI00265499CE|nr:acetate--CoA ligase family protein [Burkholderia cenocepacia]MDN7683126.1 acetate--CoA ligase family protein [Burkholderia cenocepacia]
MSNIAHSLQPLLAPASIALVGVSPQADATGNDMLLELRQSGYAGTIYFVNPKYDQIDGVRCYATLAELPGIPDLTVLAVGNARLEVLVDDAIQSGTRALVLFGSAHLEEEHGCESKLVDRIRAKARQAGIPVCGANCMGYYNLDQSLRVFPQFLPRRLVSGNVAYISQSGSALTALLWNNSKLRFNLAVSSGQEIVTTAADYLDYALDMPTTRVVAMFLEAIRDPDKFARALKKANAKEIPVVVLKVGRTEASAALALSHTGAVAGNDAVYQALFARYGVAVVETLDELAATAALFSMPNRVAAGGVAAILDSGGERELLVDVAEKMDVPFASISEETRDVLRNELDPGLEPINPLDAWGTGRDYERIFSNCFSALVRDPATSVGVLVADVTSGFWLHEGFARVCRSLAYRSDKPIVLVTNHVGTETQDLAMRLVDQGVCVLDGTKPALLALKHAMAYRDFLHRAYDTLPDPVEPTIKARWRHRLAAGGTLGEAEGLSLLADYGISVQRSMHAESVEAALDGSDLLGYPVVLKTAMPDILHKSDVGGVALNLRDREAVRDAYLNISGRLGPKVLVGAMAEGSVELAIGVLQDEQFGSVVMVAAGGIFIELLRDRAVRLAPFGVTTAHAMLDSLACRPLLDGLRGAQACDVGKLALALSRVSLLAHDLGDLIGEMDINPIKVSHRGCIAVDALVTPKHTPVDHREEAREVV